MAIEVRRARADEMLDMGAIGAYVYAGSFGDGPDNTISQSNRPEWTLCVFVDGVMASMFCAIPFTMRANGNAVKMAGVSSVGTLPEFRRRGFVRRLMTEAFARMRDEGQAIASLWASQAAIYQRYQYAMTTVLRHYEVDTVDISFHDGNAGSGVVSRSPLSDSLPRLKKLYIEHIADRMCYLHRSSSLWKLNVLEESEAEGPLHVAFCTRNGRDVGYLVYTTRSGRNEHASRGQEMKIRDLVALDVDAYRSLWSFVGAHDMVGRVTWTNAPSDDPSPELFAEPRLLHTQDREGLWLRMINAEQAMAERGYCGVGTLRIGIGEDSLAPWNAGVYELDATPEGATVQRVNAEPELRMSLKALALLYSGRCSARQLHSWGMLEGDAAVAGRAADIFAMPHAAHAPDHF